VNIISCENVTHRTRLIYLLFGERGDRGATLRTSINSHSHERWISIR